MNFRIDRRAVLPMGSLVAVLLLAGVHPAWAQGRVRIRGSAPDPAELEKKMQEYEKGSLRVSREGRDGVYLAITYWRAKNPGQETPVVLLLPMKGRTQRDWYPFAHQLYSDGFAVVTFDFRGHGDSTHINPETYKTPEDIENERKMKEYQRQTGRRVVIPGSSQAKPARTRGDTINFQDDFRTTKELGEMMVRDLEDIKRFLLELHNNGEFNVQQLGIVAAELSCNVVLNWMAEYEFKDGGKTGWTRQGGDLAALVLISPSTNYEGYRAETKFGKAADDVPILIVSSNDRRLSADASRLARSLKVPELQSDDSKRRSPGFFRPESAWMTVNSTLQGTALFKPPVDKIDSSVQGYLAARLKDPRGRIWKKRKLDVDFGFGTDR